MSKFVNWYTFGFMSLFLLGFDYWLTYIINIKWVTGLIFMFTIILLVIIIFVLGDIMAKKKVTKNKKSENEKQDDLIDLNVGSETIKKEKYSVTENLGLDEINDEDIDVFKQAPIINEMEVKENHLKENIQKKKAELEEAQREYLKFKGVF